MSEKSQKACKSMQTNYSVQSREMVVAIAGPRHAGVTIARLLELAARKLGFTFARTSNIYHLRARRIEAGEWERMKAVFNETQEGAARRRELMNELATRTATLRSGQRD